MLARKNLGLYVSEYPGSFSVSLPIYLLDYLSAKLTDEFFIRTRKEEKADLASGQSVSFKDIFPFFILYFIGASVITTIAMGAGIPASVFAPIKELSKFFIVLAMAAIGLNTDLLRLIRTGGKPILMGACCWVGITAVSLGLQSALGIW